eukprot:3735127-Rhodomonas_salina.2
MDGLMDGFLDGFLGSESAPASSTDWTQDSCTLSQLLDLDSTKWSADWQFAAPCFLPPTTSFDTFEWFDDDLLGSASAATSSTDVPSCCTDHPGSLVQCQFESQEDVLSCCQDHQSTTKNEQHLPVAKVSSKACDRRRKRSGNNGHSKKTPGRGKTASFLRFLLDAESEKIIDLGGALQADSQSCASLSRWIVLDVEAWRRHSQ